MDFGLTALIIIAAGKLLDYAAPRTKTTVDDKIRGGFQWALGFLPFVNKRLADAVDEAKQEPPVVVAREIEGFGKARDHRA